MATPKGIQALKSFKPYLAQYKGTIVIALIAMVISTIITVGAGLFLQLSIDKIPEDPALAGDYINGLLMKALIAIGILMVTQFLAGYNIRKLSAKLAEDIRTKVFSNIIKQDMIYIEKQFSGDMQTRIVADIGEVSSFLSTQIPVILMAFLSLIGGLVGAIYVNSKLTIMILIAVPFIFLPFIILSKRLQGLSKSVQDTIAEVGRYSGEVFRNIKIVKAYGQEQKESENFIKLAANASQTNINTGKLQIILSVVVSSLALSGIVAILTIASKDIYAGTMTVGSLMAFGYFAFTILKAFGNITSVISALNIATGAAQKIYEFFNVEKSQKDYATQNLDANHGVIEFNNVAFYYPSRPDAQILKGINLSIPAGAKVAIVGHSGAGKSTLVELLLRFYQPQQGNIIVGGHDITQLNELTVRAVMGFLPQKELLISGNVKDNIAYGIDNASDEQIALAAKQAHADGFIEKLPQGYQTDLAEAGDRLSGGQKQRISLARALIRNPQILLLDEPNSALDSESERFIAESIDQWATTNKRTVITIAHRLSTVKNADLIVVMDEGSVVSQGTHDQLSQNCTIYQNLLNPASAGEEALIDPDQQASPEPA